MKGLGHIFVAQKVLGESVLAAQGALLPELVPYLLGDIFEYEELHEGGKTLFDFLKAKDPQNLDLALGLLTHGVTYGADGFNTRYFRGGTGYAHQKEAPLIPKIFGVHPGIDEATAKAFGHNYVNLGMDLLIQRDFPGVVIFAQKAVSEVDVGKISRVLADCFGKERKEVKIVSALRILFEEIYTPENLTDLSGLARSWQSLTWHLSKGVISTKLGLAQELIKEAGNLVEDDYQEFFSEIAEEIRFNLINAGFIGG